MITPRPLFFIAQTLNIVLFQSPAFRAVSEAETGVDVSDALKHLPESFE